MCAPPPIGPDIHSNAAAHGVIANEFLRCCRERLPN
jgi:hypothetical protein